MSLIFPLYVYVIRERFPQMWFSQNKEGLTPCVAAQVTTVPIAYLVRVACDFALRKKIMKLCPEGSVSDRIVICCRIHIHTHTHD